MTENDRHTQPERWIKDGLTAIGDGLTWLALAIVVCAVAYLIK